MDLKTLVVEGRLPLWAWLTGILAGGLLFTYVVFAGDAQWKAQEMLLNGSPSSSAEVSFVGNMGVMLLKASVNISQKINIGELPKCRTVWSPMSRIVVLVLGVGFSSAVGFLAFIAILESQRRLRRDQ